MFENLRERVVGLMGRAGICPECESLVSIPTSKDLNGDHACHHCHHSAPVRDFDYRSKPGQE